MKQRYWLCTAALLSVSLFLVGCAGPVERPTKNYEFHSGLGKVFVNGKEYKGGGKVYFSPSNDPNFTAEGAIGADGGFVLVTTMHNPKKNDKGVPAGEYDVKIMSTDALQGGTPIDIRNKVVVKANDGDIVVKMN